jgi:hypothetical protein
LSAQPAQIAPLQHDISLSSFEQGSAIVSGSGVNLDIDFHRCGPCPDFEIDQE